MSGVEKDRDEVIGLIAGGGKFPWMVARAARRQGVRVAAVAHRGETDPALAENVDEIRWVRLGQLGGMVKALRKMGVHKALMAGTISKKRMFVDLRPDFRGAAFISKRAILHDDDVLRALAQELSEEGIEIVSSTAYLPELMAPIGCLTKKRPGKRESEDIQLGWRIAKELGRLDIGQCVVLRNRTILALEAIEGTDCTIRRGGELAREKAVVVKVSKPNQDLRFDMPTVGLETLRVMIEVKASVLAIEAGKTLVIDRDEMIAGADRARIAIVSLEKSDS